MRVALFPWRLVHPREVPKVRLTGFRNTDEQTTHRTGGPELSDNPLLPLPRPGDRDDKCLRPALLWLTALRAHGAGQFTDDPVLNSRSLGAQGRALLRRSERHKGVSAGRGGRSCGSSQASFRHFSLHKATPERIAFTRFRRGRVRHMLDKIRSDEVARHRRLKLSLSRKAGCGCHHQTRGGGSIEEIYLTRSLSPDLSVLQRASLVEPVDLRLRYSYRVRLTLRIPSVSGPSF